MSVQLGSIVDKIPVLKKSRYSPRYHGRHVFLKLYGIAVHLYILLKILFLQILHPNMFNGMACDGINSLRIIEFSLSFL